MPLLSLDRINQWVPLDFMLKTDKMKLPLHEFSFVKATAPKLFVPFMSVQSRLPQIRRIRLHILLVHRKRFSVIGLISQFLS